MVTIIGLYRYPSRLIGQQLVTVEFHMNKLNLVVVVVVDLNLTIVDYNLAGDFGPNRKCVTFSHCPSLLLMLSSVSPHASRP